ncbi:hypothetical protein Pint_17414 [Pistacia integerrima]|uniref:Uncharacterized protein n=1 Tax=Pistacia integerrima TaxID=434235 RepID=A0ACC0YWS4_9ROSI|nr:hypothetical protein Pint_17414 [Pistacia integerrima]
MFTIFQTYNNLILQAVLSLSLTLLLTYLKIPVLFLQGLFTYVHPDHVGNNNTQQGVRAAIRRPSSSDSAKTNAELKKRSKAKEKFEFDENNAQIFRLKLDEGHLQTRIYFKEYDSSFIYSFVGLSCLLLYLYLDKSASKRSERQLSLIVGFLGFVLGLMICSGIVPKVLDFDFGSIDGFGKIFVAVLMGCIAGCSLYACRKECQVILARY